jgi:hypothetical protein
VHGDGYPIEITMPSELVHAATDATSPDEVMMHAASLVNGVSGIARMFGYPLPMVPETLRSQAQESVKLLKQ